MGNEKPTDEAWGRLLDAMPPWARRLASMASDTSSWEEFAGKVAGEQTPFWQGLDPQDLFRGVMDGVGIDFGRSTVRAGRGDVRSAILALLMEEPMHGYQLMQEMSRRSEGAWRPSPGSVYPTLSVMEEEGLVAAEQRGGRKVFSLTAEGLRVASEEEAAQPAWESVNERAQDAGTEESADGAAGGTRSTASSGSGSGLSTQHARAVDELASAVGSVLRVGDGDQAITALDILVQARRDIYKILASD